ncbi:pyridoxamine 5'-phosphate oxidase family protein [Eubacteriales bacterium OttesenSCG-928-G02]|nr:pyridoxamine 5'-phosphate oxidase family protein [Eubacteriales bacterium OttesenSCG-928-G02]
MDVNLFVKANQIIKSCDAVYLSVLDEEGYPHVSTVSNISPQDMFKAYFAVGINSNKFKRLCCDNRSSICYRSDNNNITLVGEINILNDQKTKSQYWLDWFIDHFPDGKTDPNYCILEFITKRVSLFIDAESAEFTVDELLSVQSRCGLLCSFCSYREEYNCGGCIETNGNPFHGECPVAKCCQDKTYNHCGECESLPDRCTESNCKKIDQNGFYKCTDCKNTSCGKLYSYSYTDPDHGDNPPGARVMICRTWKR